MTMMRTIIIRLLGRIFLLSRISKVVNIPAFACEVCMYTDAYLMDGIGLWSQPIAIAVCAVEILVGFQSGAKEVHITKFLE